MTWCLTGQLANKFKQMIQDGSLDIEQFATKMSSKERHQFLSQNFGEDNAGWINAEFERKLLLKNQQAGIENWVKRVGGLKPETQKDLLSRVGRMDRVLQPDELFGFMGDLAEQKLGVGVTLQEATKITELAKNVTERKTAIPESAPNGSTERLNYGAGRVAFQSYISDLKTTAQRKTFIEWISHPLQALSDISGFAKSVKSTLDDSWFGRQGLKTLLTHPTIWARSFTKSLEFIGRELAGKKDVMGGVMADIYSRQNAVNGNYGKWKLDLGMNEEAFPTSLPEKIPVVNRVYKAAETAFTASARRVRADLADYYYDIAQKSGADVVSDPVMAQSFGKLVNSLTARGYLGRVEGMGKITNNVLFAIRNIKSNIDFLTAHQLQKDVSPFVRKQAAINLLKAVSGIGAVLTVANAAKPGSVDFDPHSADFGKIKIGDTRFDVSGGMSSLVVLASRLATMSTKSSTTGKVQKLNTGVFGKPTAKDVIYNFWEGKLSPAGGLVKDILAARTYQGQTPTPAGELYNFLTPMIVTDYVDLQTNPNSADIIATMMADALGIGVTTYQPKTQTKSKKQKSGHWTDFVK